jgi:hypothetical protein
MKTDTQLQRDVMDELEFEPSVDASNINLRQRHTWGGLLLVMRTGGTNRRCHRRVRGTEL